MKTAISIPDKIFKSADNIAHKMGISRSELYTKAIEEYIKDLSAEQITEKLNEIYNDDQNNENMSNLMKIQLKSLKISKDNW